jgi:hypothetical protein
LGKKNLCANLDVTTKERKKLLEEIKKFLKVPKRETPENKVARELEVAAIKVKLKEASAVHATAIGACYDLFCQLLADDPQVQWDRTVREVHKVNLWTALDGTKHKGLRMKISKLLKDCITFHKRTVFSVDTVKRQKSYMMGSLKKPHRMSVKQHVSRFETMNGYISLLPTLQDSSLAVASTKSEDVPLSNAILASIVLAICHINWRNQ